MPSTKAIISWIIFGGLGITAITASSFLPEEQLGVTATPGAASHGFARPGDPARAAESPPAKAGADASSNDLAGALRHAAGVRLGIGELLQDPHAWEPVNRSDHAAFESWNVEQPGAATSYEPVELDLDTAAPPRTQWFRHTLRAGESLGALWKSGWDLRLTTLYGMLADPENARILNLVHPGQEVEWRIDEDGELLHLRLWADEALGHEWVRNDDGGFARGEVRNIREITHIVLSGEVNGSIETSLSARNELSPDAAAALGVLLDRHLPVRKQAQTGDRFTLLLEQETLVGDDTPYEIRLLAFEYRGKEVDISAARYTDGRFYTLHGESLLPPFDRKPFAGNHPVSSGFNPRRRHPVTGRIAPHPGTDFSMPVGTPILAPADGMVTRVDQHPYAGRYIEIEHGQGHSTRYLHLQRALVAKGDEVRRGERIALSGNSGRTTGPHLHYELHVDGRPVDVLRAELPSHETLADAELERFQRIAAPLIAELRDAAPSRQIAMRPFAELSP
ncbi:Peptidase M23 - like protein [Thioalkalivibrio nitratireducens DSM 14787]|uniref:Peptidase M23-like protein n=1 Tax=Thioalkalivibrio nitratireducens (strain DSM 14787 / UNIQEM 213 / ALEN2) TaxID=1255043 RepID=L0DUC3_THIND|nr:peptidoglycan DD-metalloendopeptidase family protein [Thioalkalivibrio nitratireducens]AGA33199.1 Peptidase M23 - like protein [Thioalkalivibrio nitratireducens DSM 14787]